MFTTDKELRAKKSIHTGRKTSGLQSKLPSPSSSLSSNPHNENNALSKATVLDQARIAREERQLGRECLKSALIIQSWWRMCHQQRKWRSQLRSDVVKKCQDIERVNSILKTVVCPDVGIGITLIRSFIFSFSTNNNDNVRREETKAMALSLLLLCRCVLVPSLMNMDTSKNIAAAMSIHLSCRLILLILRYYETLPRVPPASSDVVSILNCLPLLIGGGESFRMKFSENLRNSLDNIRRKLEKLDIIDRICSIFFQKLEPWMLHTNNGDSASTSIVGNLSSVNGPMLDILMRFLLNLLVSNNTGPSGLQLKSNASPSARALHFFRIVLAAPMLSLQLSAPVLTMLISLEEFDSILHSFVDSFPHLQLAPSPLAAFEPALWLLGNLCFVGSCILKHAAEMKSRRADQLLSAYLVLLSKLLITSPVPGFLCGRRSVVWTMRGSEAIAAGVPSGLYAQANALFELHFLQGLLAYHLFIDVSSYPLVGTAEDVLEIETSQRSSSLQITSESIKEATLDQSWLSGNWAKKLLGNVSATLTMTSRKESSYFDVATGSGKANVDSVKKLCILLSIILPPATFAHFASDNYKGLSTFVFSTPDLSRKLWIALRLMHIEKFACHCNVERDFTPSGVFAVVLTFAAVLRVQLLASDDNDLLKKEVPLPLHQLYIVIRCFKQIAYKAMQYNTDLLHEHKTKSSLPPSSSSRHDFIYYGLRTISAVLSDLHTRWARRPFSSVTLFEFKDTTARAVRAMLRDAGSNSASSFASTLLRTMPWCVPFYDRLTLFREIISEDRASIQGPEHARQVNDVVMLRIRRRCLLEDGMRAVERIEAHIKKRVMIKYINDFNEEELGIDSGGLFKDFWTDLSSQVFNPSYGLFSTTSSQHLFPNTTALNIYNEREVERMFSFLGLVLGKAIYENLTIQPQFSHFFLSFMHGKYNFTGLLNDLSTLDEELFRNLMFLKDYEGNVTDLSLTFSVSDTSLGTNREIELLPGGSSVAVDSSNRLRYIHAVAKYYLHDRIKLQARAFCSGLYKVIDSSLMGMFCAPELQFLISGTSSRIDIDDLRRNALYLNGYSSLDAYIGKFWSVVRDFSAEDVSLLLRFVTSCDRPPSLGFADLHPAFTIQRVDSEGDTRLPTASTCFNVLKLPTYSSQKILKDKLLFAIRSRSGFDLS